MKLFDLLENDYFFTENGIRVNNIIEFSDDSSISIQAGKGYASIPKKKNGINEYENYEVYLDVDYSRIPKKWFYLENEGGVLFKNVPKDYVIEIYNNLYNSSGLKNYI